MFTNKDMSVSDWFLYYILMIIPFVNLAIFLIVLFSSNSNRSLKNLIILQVLIVLIAAAVILFLFPELLLWINLYYEYLFQLISYWASNYELWLSY